MLNQHHPASPGAAVVSPQRRRFGRGAARVGVLALGLLLLTPATPAFADTSTASATAASVTLLNGSLLTSGVTSASNDGTQATSSNGATPPLSLLGTQGLLTAGVLSQQATANADGSSSACSGIVGAGGTLNIGPTGDCTVGGTTAGVVSIQITGLISIQAQAIVESCTAQSDGTVTAQSLLLNANLVILGISAAINSAPAPNSALVGLGAVATVGTNIQSNPVPGQITASALKIVVLGTTLGADVAQVTCGANAQVFPTSAFPIRGLPLALAIIAFTGIFAHRRRRRARAERLDTTP